MIIPEQAVAAALEAFFDVSRSLDENMRAALEAALPLMGVQRPEDVARAPKGFNTVSNARLAVKLRDYKDTLAAEIGSSIEARIKTGSEDVYGIGREIVDGEFVSSLIVAALPHTGQAGEGLNADLRRDFDVLRTRLNSGTFNPCGEDDLIQPSDLRKLLDEVDRLSAAPASPRAEGE